MDSPTKFCGSCGTQLSLDSLFCSECGARQEAPVQSGKSQLISQPQPYQQEAEQQFAQAPQQPFQQQHQMQEVQQTQKAQQQQYQQYNQQNYQQPQQYQQSNQQNYQQPQQYQQTYQQNYQQPQQYQQTYQQNYQQPQQYQQQYQQNYNQAYGSDQYYNIPKKKGAGGVVAIVLIIAIAFIGGYFGYNKLLKGKVPALDKIVAGVSQNNLANSQENLKGLSENEISEILAMRPDALIGTWEGTLTFQKIQGLENEKDMSEQERKMLEGMLEKPMKLVYYFSGKSDELVGKGVLSNPEMGDSEIDEMPYSLAVGQFSMRVQDSDAIVEFNGALGRKDGSLYIDGGFKIDVIGNGKQYIEGKWEIKQVSKTLPTE